MTQDTRSGINVAGRCGQQNGIAVCTLGAGHVGRHHDQPLGAKWGQRSSEERRHLAEEIVAAVQRV